MNATKWEYQSVKVSAEPNAIEVALEPLGRRGYQVLHVRDTEDGLLMILGRATNEEADLEEETINLFTDSQHELMAVNWAPPKELEPAGRN